MGRVVQTYPRTVRYWPNTISGYLLLGTPAMILYIDPNNRTPEPGVTGREMLSTTAAAFFFGWIGYTCFGKPKLYFQDASHVLVTNPISRWRIEGTGYEILPFGHNAYLRLRVDEKEIRVFAVARANHSIARGTGNAAARRAGLGARGATASSEDAAAETTATKEFHLDGIQWITLLFALFYIGVGLYHGRY